MDHPSLRAAVSGIAAHLPGFADDPGHPHRPRLVGPEGEDLVFSPVDHAGTRLRIYGCLPHDYVRRYPAKHGGHEITVAADRAAAAIAADIHRRLLPAYRAELATAHEWLARDAAQRRQRHDRANAIAKRLGGSWVRDWSDHLTTVHIDRRELVGPVELKLDNSGNTRITIERADATVTDRIADLLAGRLSDMT